MVEVKSLPPEVVDVVDVLHDDLHPSQSMNPMSFPEVVHMHNSLYLHAPQINKMNNIGFPTSSPSSACIHVLHVGAHRLGICGTMVRCRKSMVSVPMIADNFRIRGKYLWCVHPHDFECTKYTHDSLSHS